MHRVRHFVVCATLAVGAVAGCTVQDPAYTPASGATLSTAPTTVEYSTGRYQLYGDGSSAMPYYWVWIPKGTNPPNPPPLPATTVVTSTSQGRYQLYGDGTAASPYYWVWVPAGTTAVVPPPPPPRRP
jgi:hypothetical protein